VHSCVVPFTNQGKLHQFGAVKPISSAKLAHFDFFALNFTIWSHILSSGGDSLIILSSSYFRILLLWVQGTNKDDPFKGEPYHTISIKHFEVFLFVFESTYSHGIENVVHSYVDIYMYCSIVVNIHTIHNKKITNNTTHSNFKKYDSFATKKNLKNTHTHTQNHINHAINNFV
jgi:hypothetical protein